MDDPRRRCVIRLIPRQSRRLVAAVALVCVGVVAAVAVIRTEQRERRAEARTPAGPEAVFSSPATTAPTRTVIAALGPAFKRDQSLRPTGDAGQAKLWFHEGRWWGVLLSDGEHRIHAFDPADGWRDTGPLVDPRLSSHADVLSDGGSVVVITAGRGASASNAVEVRRFTYDPRSRLYRSDPQFPVRLSNTGARHVTIARTADGTLWAAFVTELRLEVARTLGNDANWSRPASIPTDEAAQPIDAAAVAASGDRVAVLAASTAGTVVAFTTTTAEPDRWTSSELLAGAPPDVDRIVSLRAGIEDGAAFVGLTEIAPPEDGNGNGLAPHLVVLASTDGKTWTSHAVSRVDDDLADPTLLIDESDRSVVVLAASEGTVRSKRAALDRLVFPSGRGVPLLPSDVGGVFREPTTARRTAAPQGLLVLAADSGIGRYGHVAVDVPDVSTPTGQSQDATILAEAFDSRPAEAGPPPGWQLASDAGTGALSLQPGVSGSALRVRTAVGAGSARACRRFVVGRQAPIVVSMSVRVAGDGDGDAVIASLRGGREAASVRLDDRGRVAWFDGDVKRASARSAAPGAWYRLEVRVDPAARTYAFTVKETGGSTETIASADGLRWRSPEATFPDQLCVSTRDGDSAEIAVDDVEVRR